jgi:DNA-binding response OmpR family regulator
MRPKKVILLVDDNETALSLLRYTLTLHGYRVLSAASSHEAIQTFRRVHVDMVVASFSLCMPQGDKLAFRLKKIDGFIPVLALGARQQLDALDGADAVLDPASCSALVLLERVKVMTTRKSGPRKGCSRKPPAAVPADAATAGCAL